MTDSLTPYESIALSLILKVLGVPGNEHNKDVYLQAAARAPKLTALHADVNRRLQETTASDTSVEICRFKAGDKRWSYEPYPTSLSLEVVRSAWVKSGMRELQRKAKNFAAQLAAN